MRRQSFRPRLTIGGKQQLAQICGVEAAEAITDWVAVVKEESGASGEIPILALALAELVRRCEQAEKSGMNDLAQIVKKHLVGCAAAILTVEDGAHSGLNRQSRSAIARPRAQARNKKNRRE